MFSGVIWECGMALLLPDCMPLSIPQRACLSNENSTRATFDCQRHAQHSAESSASLTHGILVASREVPVSSLQ